MIFNNWASLFAKRYAFLEWKKDALQFDALDLRPWIERISQTKDDVAYLDLCAEYVASFQDSHSYFQVPSFFTADLGFSVDYYDGKVLIEAIDRTLLPEREYPFRAGDQLISIDGQSADDAIAGIARVMGEGNPRTARRAAAAYLTYRTQVWIPTAHQIGDSASLVIQRREGNTESYTIPWQKSGEPYTLIGPVPSPVLSVKRNTAAEGAGSDAGPWPFYMRRTRKLQVMRSRPLRASTGIGAISPVFSLPAGFVQRVGSGRYDDIFVGTLKVDGRNIGFLRIPSFDGYTRSVMEREIRYLEDNTDGLILDLTRNPGGMVCEAERLMRHFAVGRFQTAGNSVRVTWDFILGLQMDIEFAREYGATSEELAELDNELAESRAAYAKNRGFTKPIPFCGTSLDIPPAVDRSGNSLVYTKPVMVLVDDRSASAAELFASAMQDNRRAMIYGYRTAGAGGATDGFYAGTYSETYANLAWSIAVRSQTVGGTEFPAAPYIENIGVRPDQTADYMTEENLLAQGAPFARDLFAAMVEYVNSKAAQ